MMPKMISQKFSLRRFSRPDSQCPSCFYAVSPAAESPKKLRLAYAGWEIGTAVSYIGVDAGLFKKNGLDRGVADS